MTATRRGLTAGRLAPNSPPHLQLERRFVVLRVPDRRRAQAGVPLAAVGLLSPVLAGAAMALSSVSVVTNALLLKRWKGERNG